MVEAKNLKIGMIIIAESKVYIVCDLEIEDEIALITFLERQDSHLAAPIDKKFMHVGWFNGTIEKVEK